MVAVEKGRYDHGPFIAATVCSTGFLIQLTALKAAYVCRSVVLTFGAQQGGFMRRYTVLSSCFVTRSWPISWYMPPSEAFGKTEHRSFLTIISLQILEELKAIEE